MKHYVKVLMGLSFMFGCIFVTSGNAEAVSGGGGIKLLLQIAIVKLE
ncbi:hypothetical protein QMA40_29955 (plasmid) [Bacillus thuringiensis]